MDDEIMELAGPHAAPFADYVRHERALGHAIPSSYQTVPRDMSRVLASLPPIGSIVDRRAAELIARRREGEPVPTRCKRMAICRQPCVFLRGEGYDAHVLPHNLGLFGVFGG